MPVFMGSLSVFLTALRNSDDGQTFVLFHQVFNDLMELCEGGKTGHANRIRESST